MRVGNSSAGSFLVRPGARVSFVDVPMRASLNSPTREEMQHAYRVLEQESSRARIRYAVIGIVATVLATLVAVLLGLSIAIG
jgi:hypothetical protein